MIESANPVTTPVEARIGRYAHAELQAMQGRRGRKPPEYFQLFPERRPAAAASPVAGLGLGLEAASAPGNVPAGSPTRQRRVSSADALAERIRAASPAVRRIIEALLDLPVGATIPAGSEAGSTAAVEVAPADAAPTPTPAPAQTATELSPAATFRSVRDPVYADPEAEVPDHRVDPSEVSVVG